jgi:hypothetical protein
LRGLSTQIPPEVGDIVGRQPQIYLCISIA